MSGNREVHDIGYVPYKSCPLKLYQISSKFRDEMRSKFGLIRSKEFIMKDLYTFDISIQDADETYAPVRNVYDKIFTRQRQLKLDGPRTEQEILDT